MAADNKFDVVYGRELDKRKDVFSDKGVMMLVFHNKTSHEFKYEACTDEVGVHSDPFDHRTIPDGYVDAFGVSGSGAAEWKATITAADGYETDIYLVVAFSNRSSGIKVYAQLFPHKASGLTAASRFMHDMSGRSVAVFAPSDRTLSCFRTTSKITASRFAGPGFPAAAEVVIEPATGCVPRSMPTRDQGWPRCSSSDTVQYKVYNRTNIRWRFHDKYTNSGSLAAGFDSDIPAGSATYMLRGSGTGGIEFVGEYKTVGDRPSVQYLAIGYSNPCFGSNKIHVAFSETGGGARAAYHAMESHYDDAVTATARDNAGSLIRARASNTAGDPAHGKVKIELTA